MILAVEGLLLRALPVEVSDLLARQIGLVADILVWLVFAWLVVGGLELFVWKGIVRRRTGVEVPGLLTHLVAAAVYFFTIYGIISFVFERPVTGLVISSGVVAAVVGLAMQSTLSDVFAGIAISIERPYRIGDWIELEGGVVGRVVDITWRSTRLLSRTNTIYVLPNSKVLSSVVENISLPEKRFAHSIYVSLPPEVPPDLARRLLLDAALSCRWVLAEPLPVVRFWDVGTRPYQYLLFVHFADYESLYLAKGELLMQIWSLLSRAGITPAAVAQDMFMFQGRRSKAVAPSDADLLQSTEVFASLTEEERERLMAATTSRAFRAGETIVAEAEPGASLYILSSGVVRVTRSLGEDKAVELARLGLGSCFGEMSLLTGEPRSATVSAFTDCHVLEVKKQDLDPILRRRPEVIEQLAQVMAERQVKTHAVLTAQTTGAASDVLRAYIREMRARIGAFFNVTPVQEPLFGTALREDGATFAERPRASGDVT